MKKTVLIVILMIAGAAIAAYPFIADLRSAQVDRELLQAYDRTVDGLDAQTLTDELERAHAYNDSVSGKVVEDPFVAGSGAALPLGYGDVLNVQGNGLMGYLTIPKLDISLPVYHDTTEEILQKGIGHIPTTALPVGGEGTHCVLTGHRGLSGRELFTNVDKLAIGDIFYMTVLGEIIAYEVDDIRTTLPADVTGITSVEGKDYMTLATCTPLGINSHRLLIRGIRTDYIPGGVTPAVGGLSEYEKRIIIAACAAAGILAVSLLIARRIRRRK
jgi:sortase A